ncbi:MAG: hypothetical protein I3J02_00930 [Prevotella sp.]|nr:hypothetical protein [Prevotella sp.]
MKNIFSRTEWSRVGLGCMAALLTLASCSDDWDNHYNPVTTDASSLWESISLESSLSNFAKVLKATGYDQRLSGSQTYTVFALNNDGLTSTQADSLIAAYQTQKSAGVRDNDNTVVRQFIQNHISLYRHPVSTQTSDSIKMMNGKYAVLTPTSVGGNTFTVTNQLHSNGVLFTLGSQVKYFPNVFEYLGIDPNLDSIYQFVNSFSTYEFVESSSVPGGIVNGQTVYLDSVMRLRNKMLDVLGYLSQEDSTYWMLAPTNAEWSRMVTEFHPYFNYDNTVTNRDSMQETNTRLAILKGTVFSRTINPDKAFRDSAVSTSALSYQYRRILGTEPYYLFYHPFDADGIFAGAQQMECSNGMVLKSEDFRIKKEQTFFQTIKVEAEELSRQDTIIDAEQPLEVRTVQSGNAFYDKISNNQFVELIASNTSTDPNHFPYPTVMYSVPEVLSNVGYDIYVVVAPVQAYNPDAIDADTLPNKILGTLYYTNQDAKLQQRRLGIFTSKAGVVDTIRVASNFTFPVCSYGLAKPSVKLRIQSQVGRNETAKYATNLRLDCVIFKPHEE